MANLVAAGAFRFVHRGVGDFDEAFDDLPVEILMFRRLLTPRLAVTPQGVAAIARRIASAV